MSTKVSYSHSEKRTDLRSMVSSCHKKFSSQCILMRKRKSGSMGVAVGAMVWIPVGATGATLLLLDSRSGIDGALLSETPLANGDGDRVESAATSVAG